VAVPGASSNLACYAKAAKAWLQSTTDTAATEQSDSSVAALLSAAGYGLQPLVPKLEALLQAAEAAGNPTCTDMAPIHALEQQLQSVGQALTSIPVVPMCNNPHCSNVSGPTELSLVTGTKCKCGECRVAHYCCRACQKQHRPDHREACKALAAARLAASLPAVGHS